MRLTDKEVAQRRAIVWVPVTQFHKIAKGIVLPEGYEISDTMPFIQHLSMSVGFMVCSADLPMTDEGEEFPSLQVVMGYEQILVERWNG